MSYYDVDAILADAQKVPTKFNLDIPNLSHLDSTHPEGKSTCHVLRKNTVLPLPLWLAEMVAVTVISEPTVTLDLPSCLTPAVLNALKASPVSIDLRSMASHYYALGARMLELFEEEEMLEVLVNSWRLRTGLVGDFAAKGGGAVGAGQGAGMGQEGVEFLRGLDEWERALWGRSHEGGKRMREWMGDMGRG